MTGAEQARQVLRALPREVKERVLRAATTEIADEARDDVVRHAPVDEGRLIGNIIGSRAGRAVKASVSIRAEGKTDSPRNAFYWRFLEFGTRKMAAHPFIRPVFDRLAATIESTIARFLPARVERELRRLGRQFRRQMSR